MELVSFDKFCLLHGFYLFLLSLLLQSSVPFLYVTCFCVNKHITCLGCSKLFILCHKYLVSISVNNIFVQASTPLCIFWLLQSTFHYAIGLKILNQLISEMNQVSLVEVIRLWSLFVFL